MNDVTPEEQARRDALTAKKTLLAKLPINEQAKRLAILKEQKSYFEAVAEALSSEISILGGVFFQNALESQTASIRVSGELFNDGAERIVTPDTNFQVSVKNQLGLFVWLRAHGCSEMIKEVVNPQTLKSFVTSAKDNNSEVPGEDVLAIFTVESANVRRAPKTAKKGI